MSVVGDLSLAVASLLRKFCALAWQLIWAVEVTHGNVYSETLDELGVSRGCADSMIEKKCRLDKPKVCSHSPPPCRKAIHVTVFICRTRNERGGAGKRQAFNFFSHTKSSSSTSSRLISNLTPRIASRLEHLPDVAASTCTHGTLTRQIYSTSDRGSHLRQGARGT